MRVSCALLMFCWVGCSGGGGNSTGPRKTEGGDAADVGGADVGRPGGDAGRPSCLAFTWTECPFYGVDCVGQDPDGARCYASGVRSYHVDDGNRTVVTRADGSVCFSYSQGVDNGTIFDAQGKAIGGWSANTQQLFCGAGESYPLGALPLGHTCGSATCPVSADGGR
jgi:hypothetical protein